MFVFSHGDVCLAYDVCGPEGAAPLVLLHGINGARSTWHDVAPVLASRHRVYALDHRGHGDSTKPPGTYDIAHWAGDAVAFLEQVVAEPAILIGHSLGGIIAAQVIADRADLVLAALLEDPPLYLSSAAELNSTPLGPAFALVLTFLRSMRSRGSTLEEYVASASAAPRMNGGGTLGDMLGPEGIGRYAKALMDVADVLGDALEYKASSFDPFRPLRAPVHVLRGEPRLGAGFRREDEATFLATNPHATVELVAGAGHLIHDEQPERFIDDVSRFLVGQVPPARSSN